MKPIRLDENSMDSQIKQVLDMKEGELFSISPDFVDKFMRLIPDGKVFRFTPLVEGSDMFKKYGKDHYFITRNRRVISIR